MEQTERTKWSNARKRDSGVSFKVPESEMTSADVLSVIKFIKGEGELPEKPELVQRVLDSICSFSETYFASQHVRLDLCFTPSALLTRYLRCLPALSVLGYWN